MLLLPVQAGAVLGCAGVWRSQLTSPAQAPVARTQTAWKGSTGVLHLALSNLNLEAGGLSACKFWGCIVCLRNGLGCDFFGVKFSPGEGAVHTNDVKRNESAYSSSSLTVFAVLLSMPSFLMLLTINFFCFTF